MIITYALPPNPQKTFESDSDSIIFGRRRKSSQHVDLDLEPDSYVSKRHARLTYENNEYWIEDLRSGNGTWVNDKKITQKTLLGPGTKFRIGWTILEVVMEAVPLAPELPEEPEEVVAPEPQVPDLPEPVEEPEEIVTPDRRKEPEPEGVVVSVSDEKAEPLVEPATGEGPETRAWRQLKALNDFSKALGTTTTLESLSNILVEHLQAAIPNAQRGAVLLPEEGGELLLKAHWPEGNQSVSMTWVNRAFENREAFIWAAAPPAEDQADDDTPHSALYYDVQSSIYVPLISGEEVLGVLYVDNFYTPDAFSTTDLELLKAVSNQVALFIRDRVLKKDLQREEVLRSNLLRQFSPKVAEQMVEKARRLQRGGERVDPVTILISDVRSFTALSAKMDPDDVVRMLNEMFDAFVPIVSEYDGIVDKYVGDSVLAVFGSPENDPHQCEKAVQAALEMQHAMEMIGQGRKVRRLLAYQVGIGVHTGEAIHGFIGSTQRIEFTVIGDTVNRAARFCDGAGPGEVLISKKVYERVYRLVEVQPKTIKTKHPETEGDLEGYVVNKLKKKD